MRARRLTRGTLLSSLLALACIGPDDDPSQLKDLRLLAVRLDPPELMAPSCEPSAAVAVALAPVRVTALVVHPRGGAVAVALAACGDPSFDDCDQPREQVPLASISGPAGVIELGQHALGSKSLRDQPLAQLVLERDPYRGLGGLRLPLVLEVSAEGEVPIRARKLMVYSCPLFPSMRANLQPSVPPLLLEGTPWPAEPERSLVGPGPFELQAIDVSALEEAYTVPSFSLEPVDLVERIKLAWHADLGKLSQAQTGGEDLGGQQSRHTTEWSPPKGASGRTVTFFVVARDGRGGMAWETRRVRWDP